MEILIDGFLGVITKNFLERSTDIGNFMEIFVFAIDGDNGGFIFCEDVFHFEEFSCNVFVDLFLVKFLFENAMRGLEYKEMELSTSQ
jgi:hypothetical protein